LKIAVHSTPPIKHRTGTPRADSFTKKAVLRPLLVEVVAAGVFGNKLRFGSWIFSAVQGSNWVNGTVRCAVRLIL